MAKKTKTDSPTAASKPKKLPSEPTGIDVIDRLSESAQCSIEDYVTAVSAYVRASATLTAGAKKAAQIRLSAGLSRALACELVAACPEMTNIEVGEKKVSGALRDSKADLIESKPLDGLRLAVELKPVNLAVGRAIWNRFGDLRVFAVNIHLKFPFAVVGGVLVVPLYEEVGSEAAKKAGNAEAIVEGGQLDPGELMDLASNSAAPGSLGPAGQSNGRRRSTVHLIERAIQRLVRAGGRKTEADAAHLLEGIAVVVYDPTTGMIDESLPAPGSGLRWKEFIRDLVTAYRGRFEG